MKIISIIAWILTGILMLSFLISIISDTLIIAIPLVISLLLWWLIIPSVLILILICIVKKQYKSIFSFLSLVVMLVISSWFMNGGYLLTISEEDRFTDALHECMTRTCLESFSSFYVNENEHTVVKPYFLDKNEYKDPYRLRYSIQHDNRTKIKSITIKVVGGNKTYDKVFTGNELNRNDGRTSVYLENIKFDSSQYDIIKTKITYESIISNKVEKHEELIETNVELDVDKGLKYWWAWMGI